MKRLIEDPWILAASKFKEGEIIEGPITQIVDYGAFVRINDEINGLIHKSEIADPEPQDITSVINIGDVVKTKIINIDLGEHRLGLSLKDIDSSSEKATKATKAESKTKEPEKEVEDDKPAEKNEETVKKTPAKKIAKKKAPIKK